MDPWIIYDPLDFQTSPPIYRPEYLLWLHVRIDLMGRLFYKNNYNHLSCGNLSCHNSSNNCLLTPKILMKLVGTDYLEVLNENLVNIPNWDWMRSPFKEELLQIFWRGFRMSPSVKQSLQQTPISLPYPLFIKYFTISLVWIQNFFFHFIVATKYPICSRSVHPFLSSVAPSPIHLSLFLSPSLLWTNLFPLVEKCVWGIGEIYCYKNLLNKIS